MNTLEQIAGKGLENAGVNLELTQEFLYEIFKGAFVIGMHRELTRHSIKFDGEVLIGTGHQKAIEFLRCLSLNDKVDRLQQTMQTARDHMLANCLGLTYTTTYTDTSPSNKKRIVYFHEHDNWGKNMKKVWSDRATYYSGGVAALVTAVLSYNNLVASQPVINVSQQTLFWTYLPLFATPVAAQIMKRLKFPRRVWLRDRKYLGKEKIVEDETMLDKRYAALNPQKAIYAGQFDKYALKDERGKPINLDGWQYHNKGQPLFQVIFRDEPSPSIIWVTSIEADIDGRRFFQDQPKVYTYPQPIGRDFIDKRYAREMRVEWPPSRGPPK